MVGYIFIMGSDKKVTPKAEPSFKKDSLKAAYLQNILFSIDKKRIIKHGTFNRTL
jgi:hypothetical protein